VFLRKHALVEDAKNEHLGARALEKHQVAAFLNATEARPHVITRAAERGVLRQRGKAFVKPPDVDLLRLSPQRSAV